MKISKLTLNNYKSIRELNIEFRDINILIGANGAGKSNLISFFSFLNRIMNKNLQGTVARWGGADNILYFGRKTSSFLDSTITFEGKNEISAYEINLEPDNKDSFFFNKENILYSPSKAVSHQAIKFYSGHRESRISDDDSGVKKDDKIEKNLINAFNGLKMYHFHDTSNTSAVKQTGDIHDNYYLREDASNLASFLLRLEKLYKKQYKTIESTTRLIAPFFEKFELRPTALNPDKIRLEWKEVSSDKYFNASHLSDGTLRMICLITLLLQPSPPNTIIIDEPELGLHPYAINILAGLIKSISKKVQVILSTQSVTLVNQFIPEDIIVVDRNDGQSVFRHIQKNELEDWLDDYSVGDAWEKNIIGGKP